MQLPFFYIDHFNEGQQHLALQKDNSRHIAQVLRMRMGDLLHLTDGKGHLLTTELTDANKKQCVVKVQEVAFQNSPPSTISIAISLLKNTNRFEWFLEKATEIGISAIVPLICHRTEKQNIRFERLQGILTSAMLQSRQVWRPQLAAPIAFQEFISKKEGDGFQQKFIAHCVDGQKQSLQAVEKKSVTIILIGPEGDFTPDEIALSLQRGYQPVSLGRTRLRTETAGVVAASLLCF